MDPDQRLAFVLFEIEGLTGREAAEIAGKTMARDVPPALRGATDLSRDPGHRAAGSETDGTHEPVSFSIAAGARRRAVAARAPRTIAPPAPSAPSTRRSRRRPPTSSGPGRASRRRLARPCGVGARRWLARRGRCWRCAGGGVARSSLWRGRDDRRRASGAASVPPASRPGRAPARADPSAGTESPRRRHESAAGRAARGGAARDGRVRPFLRGRGRACRAAGAPRYFPADEVAGYLLLEDGTLELESGAVARRRAADRPLEVRVAGLQVRGGGRFKVATRGRRVDVVVEEGEVAVWSSVRMVARVVAGERWTSAPALAARRHDLRRARRAARLPSPRARRRDRRRDRLPREPVGGAGPDR